MSVEDPARHPARWRQLLDGLVSVSIVAVCLALTWSILRGSEGPVSRPIQAGGSRPSNPPGADAPLPKEPLSIDGAATRGDAKARVAVIEYSDFQCPYCASFTRDTLPKIQETYVESGKILLAFRHLPLENIHPFARKAAEAAECARRQEKFWPMHDLLFQNQAALASSDWVGYANQAGLDQSKFQACMSGQLPEVQSDLQTAHGLLIGGTPTFLIGTVQPDRRIKVEARLSGAAPFQKFQSELDKLLTVAQQR